MDLFIFLTDLMGKKVFDPQGKCRGRVVDFAADAVENYPRVSSFVYRTGFLRRELTRIPWEGIARLDRTGVFLLAGSGSSARRFERGAAEVMLVADVLDKQIVDVNGAKIERVNDIHLLNTDRNLRVVHADVGFRGFLRRLNFSKPFDAVTEWLFSYKLKDQFIPWRFAQPLGKVLEGHSIVLTVARQRLASLHPADLADILEELPQPDRAVFFKALDDETAADTLEEVEDAELAVDLLEAVGPERAGDIIEEMQPDEAADVLQEFDETQAQEIIGGMEDDERAEDLRELLAQDEGTAGSIMTTEYVSVPPTATVAAALRVLKKEAQEVENYDVFHVVAADEELLGVFSLREAVLAEESTPVSELMERRIVAVKPDDKLAEVADVFGKYGFATVPVVDDDGKIRGIVALRDAVAAIYPDFVKD
jgi:magnesium transporter